MDFWETHEREWWAPYAGAQAPADAPDAVPSSQNDTTGVCEFCGYAGDDVLIGVCADCAKE